MRNTTRVFQILPTCPFQSIRAFSSHSYQSFYPDECANTTKRKKVKGIQETANMKIKILVTWLRKKTAWRSNYSDAQNRNQNEHESRVAENREMNNKQLWGDSVCQVPIPVRESDGWTWHQLYHLCVASWVSRNPTLSQFESKRMLRQLFDGKGTELSVEMKIIWLKNNKDSYTSDITI